MQTWREAAQAALLRGSAAVIINPQVPLHRLVLSLSEALDHVSPSVANHQLRVACMATKMARVLGYRGTELRDVFHAAALHDIGLVKAENKLRAVAQNRLEGLGWHPEAGYLLLKDNQFFTSAAPLVRHHHASWQEGRGAQSGEEEVPLASFLIALADTVDRHLRRDQPVLEQAEALVERISAGQGREFPPECVGAFREVAAVPAFWLDVASPRIYSILSREVDWPTLVIDETAVEGIAQIFGRVVDSMSPWTGTHSAGVAATAVALSGYLHFSPREQVLMRAAGYLHDLGKVAVPAAILDKPAAPTKTEWAVLREHTYHTFRILDTIGGMPQISEWAAFHHERLDGKGYPFGHMGKDLTLGARIMAVADIFTALTEDRPYRAGLLDEQAVEVLRAKAEDGGIDGHVVSVLRAHFRMINSLRRQEQAAWASKQLTLAELMRAVPSRRGRTGTPVSQLLSDRA
jgi:HD-GYP domain-containing protein (c-di-GMP phosphodiesterase class II)